MFSSCKEKFGSRIICVIQFIENVFQIENLCSRSTIDFNSKREFRYSMFHVKLFSTGSLQDNNVLTVKKKGISLQ